MFKYHSMQVKACCKCGLSKEVCHFHKSGKKNGQLASLCKQCKNDQIKILREKRKNIEKPKITHKDCSECKENLPVSQFTKDATLKDGYSRYCKECRKSITKNQKAKREAFKIECREKTCYKCNIIKPSECFKKNIRSSDGLSYTCHSCTPLKTWTKEKQKASEQKYISRNKEKVRLKWKRQGQKPNRRVRDSLNHRIAEALRTNCVTKRNTTVEYTGCTIPFLKKWIEYQFADGMGWHNYGKWEIDHVVPCASFDLSLKDDQLKCFNWKNLQPLWKEDNIKKGNHIIASMINEHNKKVDAFSAQVKEGELTGTP